MLPRDERNTDREEALRQTQLQPVSRIAVQDQTAREKASQIQVDNIIQIEQSKFQPVIPIQVVPGEEGHPADRIEEAVLSTPIKTINPVRVVPFRTTISGVLKEKMGVANIRARTKAGAVPPLLSPPFRFLPPPPGQTKYFHTDLNALGTLTKEKTVANTPVKSLNLLDQFFNWLNAFLS